MKDTNCPVLRAFRAAIYASALPPRPGLVLAVSGGEDSTVLLHAARSLQDELGLRLIVAHFNHGLREKSGIDEDLVRRMSLGLGLNCRSARAAAPARKNIEAWAREERYKFLESVRLEEQCAAILTAHHQRDQAETLLFRMLTGRFPGRSIRSEDPLRKIIRPFLSLPKYQLHEYALNHALASVHDESNDDISRTRNRIRHRLLPLLEQDYNPQVVQALAAEAERLAEDDAYLSRLAEEEFEAARGRGLREALLSLPSALAWRALRREAEKQLGPKASKIPFRALRSLAGAVARGCWGRHPLHGAIRVELSQGRLNFEESLPRPACCEIELPIPGEAALPGNSRCLCARIVEQAPLSKVIEEGRAQRKAYFDRDLLGIDRLIVRSRLPGDSMDVWRRGTRKVKKLLQERHLTLTERSWVPIVVCKEEIIWIPGVARSGAAPVSGGTRSVVELSFTAGNTGK